MRGLLRSWTCPNGLLAIFFLSILLPSVGKAQTGTFVAPPRTIADVAAILDQEKPDPGATARLTARADMTPPEGASRKVLAEFHYDRASARALLGRLNDSIADAEKAMELGQGAVDYAHPGRFRQLLVIQYSSAGNVTKALALLNAFETDANTRPGGKGPLFATYSSTVKLLLMKGDIAQAEAYLRRSVALIEEARSSPHPGWRRAYPRYRNGWESQVETTRALVFAARGKLQDAEAAYARAEAFARASIKDLPTWEFPPPASQINLMADELVLGMARAKGGQGRFAEAEADIRRVLLSRLREQGKYNPRTPAFIIWLATAVLTQGRYVEAERLIRSALEIQATLGVNEGSRANMLSQLAGVLWLQHRPQAAAQVYAELDRLIADWDPRRRQRFELDSLRIHSLISTDRLDAGIAAAQALLKREIGRVGERHVDTAAARGLLAMGLARAGRRAEAIAEFRSAIPPLISAEREIAQDDDGMAVALRTLRARRIVEAYMSTLAGDKDKASAAAAETFALADAVRGQAVQQAVAATSARMIAGDAALAELVRKEQDLAKEISAQLGSLNNMLSLPPADRDDKDVQSINAQIEKLRAERNKTRAEIARRFPNYAALTDPKPPAIDAIRKALKPDEALLSFYFGREGSFMWAVPKDGPVSFAVVPAAMSDIGAKVRKLREALEPQAATIADIPAFDLALAYELYSLLLKPVEASWKSAKELIVVTNGALGELPLSLLPTAPTQIDPDAKTLFTGYRKVPWLARSHAVTMIPSSAALLTLRGLPPGSPKREKLIGFGDPLFNEQQALAASQPDDAASSVPMRAAPLMRRASLPTRAIDSADLGVLPRLPDTAQELQSIARALEADPTKVLYLGKDANERNVKTRDLSRFRIVAFATHGLIPGDLDGLTQPALALTAPAVAGVDGDGLLTMDEIFGLKLDADWVLLSACNTAAGAGAGAEAASGLGRAFFYAGARALLLTNWSVHSESARDLVSDLFRRQSREPRLTRGEALRQSMMALADGPGFTDQLSLIHI